MSWAVRSSRDPQLRPEIESLHRSRKTSFKETGGYPILSRPQFQQSRHSYFPGGAVRKPLSHFEGAPRPQSCSAAAGRFPKLCNGCSG